MTLASVEVSGRKRRRLPQLVDIAACILLASAPFAVFVHYNDYSFVKPEILASLAIFACIGLLLAFAGALAGAIGRVLVVVLLSTLFFDVQMDGISSWTLLGALSAGFAVLAWLLREHLSIIVCVFVGTLLISTLILPPQGGWTVEQAGAQVETRHDLPVILHIVLDEQIGVEGIPLEFDREGRLRSFLQEFYLSRGFRLFGRAFSRYYASHGTLSNLLNYVHRRSQNVFYQGFFKHGDSMSANAHFDKLRAAGYNLHVFQTDYMDVCHSDGNLVVDNCLTYHLEKIRSIETAPLASFEKMQIATGMYVRLSFMLSELRSAYASLRPKAIAVGLDLPEWSRSIGRVAPLSVMRLIDRLSEDLAHAEPGSAYYIHLMLPHFPYAYDAGCNLRGSVATWLTGYVGSVFGRRNNPKSRALRYPLYLEQVECTHTRLGELLDRFIESEVGARARIVIHGDHGSRIDLGPPTSKYEELLSPRDFVDAYATLFAVRDAAIEPGYDRRSIPMDVLFTSLMRDGNIPDGISWAGRRDVYMQAKGLNKMLVRRMPDFSNGNIVRE